MSIQSLKRVGTDSFAELLLTNNVFVDKSMFIKEFLEESGDKVVLITRPRRWGKSLNMDMLQRFLSIEVDEQGAPLPQEESLNRKLFVGGEVVIGPRTGKVKQLAPLKIAQQCPDIVTEYQGQYPVISLGLKEVTGSSYQKIEDKLKKYIAKLYDQHVYLQDQVWLTNNQRNQLARYLNGQILATDLEDSLQFLSELLSKHFGKPVYILIDEYDAPINHAYREFGETTKKGEKNKEFEKVLQLFRSLLGAALKSNPYLAQGFLTGILRIAKASLLSELNNMREYTLLDKRFITSYGFREQEVEELLDKMQIATNREEIRRWYNGYHFRGETLYNPFSIMCCISTEGECAPYWLDSGGTSLVDRAFVSDQIQKDLQALAGGQRILSSIETQVSFDILRNPVGLFSLLLFTGYLTPVAISAAEGFYELSVPNYEVKQIYKKRLLEWVSKQLQITPSEYGSLARFLAMGELATFEQSLKDFLTQSASFHQTGEKRGEVFYNGIMFCLVYCLSYYYLIESEQESGLGRADAVLIPKTAHWDHAIVLEYKVGQDASDLPSQAEAGLRQIERKGYATRAKGHAHVKKVLQICLAFCGKDVVMKHKEVTC